MPFVDPAPAQRPMKFSWSLRWMGGLVRGLLMGGLVSIMLAQAVNRKHLVVASQINNPPYEYLDEQGRPAGYINDLIRAVAEREGMELEIRALAWSEVRAAFDRGEVDVITGMVFSEERAKVMDFTIPHSYAPYVLITRKGDKQIRSERDLAGKDILVLGRSIMSEHLESMGISYHQTATHEESILGLSSGRADAAIVPKYNYLFFTHSRGIQNLQAVASEIYPAKRCFAVHKGDAALLARLNEGLFLVKQSGKMDEIYSHHFGALEAEEVPFSVMFSRSLKVVLPVTLGFGLVGVLIWSFTLKRLVDRRTKHLQSALDEVRQLSGLIPICAHCKKIRDDEGYWQAVEGYITDHSDAKFSHSLCPECVKIYYLEFREKIMEKLDLENWSGS